MIAPLIKLTAFCVGALSLYYCINAIRKGEDFKAEYIVTVVCVGVLLFVEMILDAI